MDPAARIHIASPSPPYCASCYAAVPEKRHVDFGAATDGPMLPALDGTIGTVGHSVDDVVICEECLKTAGKLLGFGDVAELQEQLEQALAANDGLHEQLAAQRAGVSDALDMVRRAAHGEHVASSANPGLPIVPPTPRRAGGGRKGRAR